MPHACCRCLWDYRRIRRLVTHAVPRVSGARPQSCFGRLSPTPPHPRASDVMRWRRSILRAAFAWQLALTIQLVAQVKLAPFVDDRLDVVSGMRAAGRRLRRGLLASCAPLMADRNTADDRLAAAVVFRDGEQRVFPCDCYYLPIPLPRSETCTRRRSLLAGTSPISKRELRVTA